MDNQLVTAMATVAFIAVLLVTVLFHIDQVPAPSSGNKPMPAKMGTS